MYPNAFLRTLWQTELRPEVFVAMPFSERYRPRFEQVIQPAVNAVLINDVPLGARRVDESKSGDSILTEIIDGIAHAQMVLADVSTVGRDAESGLPYRNGNVMYEVGVALACRQSQEVLLVRDDQDDCLFDVSTIPHMTIDFADVAVAREKLRDELISRLKERHLLHDARVRQAVHSLSREEVARLRQIADNTPNSVWGVTSKGVDLIHLTAIPRLLDKGLIMVAGEFEDGTVAYRETDIGRVVASIAASGLRKFTADRSPDQLPTEDAQGRAEASGTNGLDVAQDAPP